MSVKFKVIKEDEEIFVLLLKHKDGKGYSFVNLTKGHICPCIFSTTGEALKDLEAKKADGSIEDYIIMYG